MTTERGPFMTTTVKPYARTEHALVIVRTLHAPPEIVFEAWSSAEHARRWWYPRENGHDYACTSPFLHNRFCKTCGIRMFASGEAEFMGGKFYALSVASLDNVDQEELAAAPMRFVDGRHDRFDQAPTDTRLL